MVVFLIGYMGCGKTTIGKQLARKLAYLFIDLDTYIETKENLSIVDIFDMKGEVYFREIEKKYLHEIASNDNLVVSTGGGLPCFYDNIEFINQIGLSIYFQLPPAALVSRLANSKKDRPLIKDKTDEELLDFITNALTIREPYYMQTKIQISGFSLNVNELLEKVEHIIKKHIEN